MEENQSNSGLIPQGFYPEKMYGETARMMQIQTLAVPEEFVEPDYLGRRLRKQFSVKAGYKEPGVHRVEFIIWKEYWICNVEIDGHWRHTSYPNTTTMAEFLAGGAINKAVQWPEGRLYVEL